MSSLNPSADSPELQPGIRPEPSVALATFRVTHSGAAFHVAPSSPRRANWATSMRRLGRLQDPCDPSLSVRESHESELEAAIEAALASGSSIDGYLSLARTATGIKAIPYRGKSIVAKDVRALARMVDRGMVGFSALEALGLAPTSSVQAPTSLVQAQALAGSKGKKSKKVWVRLSLGDLRHI